jgi:hypothetical protein
MRGGSMRFMRVVRVAARAAHDAIDRIRSITLMPVVIRKTQEISAFRKTGGFGAKSRGARAIHGQVDIDKNQGFTETLNGYCNIN